MVDLIINALLFTSLVVIILTGMSIYLHNTLSDDLVAIQSDESLAHLQPQVLTLVNFEQFKINTYMLILKGIAWVIVLIVIFFT